MPRAVTPNPTLTVTWLDDGETFRTSLRAFCRANKSTSELCRLAKRLKRGRSFTEGGGAAPAFRVTRTR